MIRKRFMMSKKVRILMTLAMSIVVGIAVSASVLAYEEDVSGPWYVDTYGGWWWDGWGYVDFWACPDPDGWCYEGASFTENTATVEWDRVDTWGHEMCGWQTYSTDWDKSNITYGTYQVGDYGFGWAPVVVCPTWLQPHTVVNYSYHEVGDYGFFD